MADPVNDYIVMSIRRIRQAQGLRVADVAERSGIPLGSYSCLETGRYRINLENLFRIINVLGVRVSDVWPQGNAVPAPAKEVSERFIREAIAEATERIPAKISLDDILDIVCEAFNVTRKELKSPSRKRHLAEARTVAAALTREQRHLTMVSLSHVLCRDVSSLSHCLRRLEVRLPWDRPLQARIRESCRRLSETQAKRREGS